MYAWKSVCWEDRISLAKQNMDSWKFSPKLGFQKFKPLSGKLHNGEEVLPGLISFLKLNI